MRTVLQLRLRDLQQCEAAQTETHAIRVDPDAYLLGLHAVQLPLGDPLGLRDWPSSTAIHEKFLGRFLVRCGSGSSGLHISGLCLSTPVRDRVFQDLRKNVGSTSENQRTLRRPSHHPPSATGTYAPRSKPARKFI